MTRVPADLHRMVDHIPGSNNMMMIGLDLFIIIAFLILIIKLAILTIIGILIVIIGLSLLTIIKILISLVLKRRNGKQERLGPQTPSPLPSESVKSEQNHPTTLIMNDDYTCIPNLQLDIPMPTTPTSMPYYSDPIAAATRGIPPLTTSVSTAAAGTPSVLSLINSEEDPSMIKAQVFAGNLNEVCGSREMLCNENSPILCDSTDAHEMSKDYCNGEIVNEEKQTYTYGKKPISPTASTSTTSGDFNGLNKNTSTITVGYLNTASKSKIGTTKQTNFNQHTTNFIVCSLDSLKSFDG